MIVLAIDAGTTGVRTRALDSHGVTRAVAYREFPQHFPRPGWVEHDALDIWEAARDTLNEALGYDKAAVLNEWEPYLDAIAAASTPVRIDGRLDCHEFLLLPDDHIVKTDALDHHAAHDLIGCQDIFWDVAGAMIEWTLSRDDVQRICERIDKVTGFRRPREALAFYVIAYTAFRLGAATMSAEALAEVNPAEARRFQRRVQFYRDAAFTLLQSSLIGA